MSVENRLGIIGDGQLARMMIPPANELGFRITVVGPTVNSPAKQAGAEQIVASFTDEAATKKLSLKSDFLTVETEHVNTSVLEDLRKGGVKINPSPETVAMIQDKLTQKEFLRSNGIPIAEFRAIRDRQDILDVAGEFTYPFLLKSRFGGYDGRGNAVVTDVNDIEFAMHRFENQPLYAERFVSFKKELAVMAARSMSGDIAMYPVVETVQNYNICHTVVAPASIDPKTRQQVEELGFATIKCLKGAGVFGIEMFLTKNGTVLVNEVAPRVHNSGHYTIEACFTSQFEQHVRAVTSLPLGDPSMTVSVAVMMNILGNREGKADVQGLSKALTIPKSAVHIYGKEQTKLARKMGHITVVADTLEEALKNAKLARSLISI